ncbi:RT0821/Lpp0805 family surface protein [Microvirga sp. Mcv34]|uniref:RT0821/Lpp0805 family surface protein n=1 Tax=Microvirga sp. Mcv34 TaxID=2926016 RepID=UPI0021C966A7|nr:RT0821/Lpp0805 family surface protein [Microvirga sp. Mcv34]
MKLLVVGLLALSTSACSFSFGLSALDDEEPKSTGTVTARADTPLSPDLDQEDWRRAKAALAVALDPQGPGTQVSWDNPASTMKGTFTPMGAPFVKNDEICRSFSAHLSSPSASSLHGTACRPSGGDWAIKDVKPLKAAAKV